MGEGRQRPPLDPEGTQAATPFVVRHNEVDGHTGVHPVVLVVAVTHDDSAQPRPALHEGEVGRQPPPRVPSTTHRRGAEVEPERHVTPAEVSAAR